MLPDRVIERLEGRDLDLAVVVHLLGFRYYTIAGSGGAWVGVWPPPRLPGWERRMWPRAIHRRYLGVTPRGLALAVDWDGLAAPADRPWFGAPREVPRYHASLDAAIQLAKHPWLTLDLRQVDGGWEARALARHGMRLGYARNPARAVCVAALKAVMAERRRRLVRTLPRPRK